jgi:NADH dehydrogenase
MIALLIPTSVQGFSSVPTTMTQPIKQDSNQVKHIVIVGGGFAGLSCARKLATDSNVRVTLLDKNNYQQFQPLLYHVATGILAPSNIAFNLRGTFIGRSNVTVKMTEVVSIDLNTHAVQTAEGQ